MPKPKIRLQVNVAGAAEAEGGRWLSQSVRIRLKRLPGEKTFSPSSPKRLSFLILLGAPRFA